MSPCVIDDCQKPVDSRGYCSMHYARIRRHGSPDIVRRPYDDVDPVARFWSKVDRRGDDECWPWLGTLVRGYGQFTINRTRFRAHRFAYELSVGPIPEGLTLDHVRARGCTRTDCVNPAHLEPVTGVENTLRSDGPPAQNARKQVCSRGHEFDIFSIRPETGRPRRACRKCKALWARERRAAARAEHAEGAA